MLAISFAPAFICYGQDMPDSVELNSLSQLFDGVTFDHEMHLSVSDDCSVCHHHTTGTGVSDERCAKCHSNSDVVETVACQGCHAAEPFSAAAIHGENQNDYHFDVPGLKGAYHLNCLGCHQEMEGPVGCQDCHDRNEAGDAFYHAGTFSPSDQAAHDPTH